MNKTTMQELIEKLKAFSPENIDRKDSLVSQGYHEGIQWSIWFATKLLDKEKDHLTGAYKEGFTDGINPDNPAYKSPTDYYQKTYNQ